MFIKNFFARKVPWIYTRFLMFFVATSELLIFILAAKYLIVQDIFGFFTYLFLGIYFVFLSYIFGRYTYKVNHFSRILIYVLFNSFLVYLLFLSSLFLLSKIILNLDSIKNLDIFSFYFLICNSLQLLINSFFIKKIRKNKIWLFIGKQNEFNSLIKYSKIGRFKEDFRYYKNVVFNDNNVINSFKGIIFGNSDFIDKNQFLKINLAQKKNIPVYDLFSWSELFLQRFPSEVLINKKIILDNFSLPKYSYQHRLKTISEILLSIFILILSSPIIFLASFLFGLMIEVQFFIVRLE